MKAIYHNEVYQVVENHAYQVELLGSDNHRHMVDYGDQALIIDPTDGDLAEAFAAHQAEDPHCTCPDCMEAHAEALDESEDEPGEVEP